MIKNNTYKPPLKADLKEDPIMEALTEKVLPLVRVIHKDWGQFKPAQLKRQSSQLPAAYINRFGFSQVKDISGNGQKTVTNYAIAIVMQDGQGKELEAMRMENGIINALQDFAPLGQKIENLKTSDFSDNETQKNNIQILGLGFQIPYIFEGKDEELSDFLGGNA